VPFPGADRNAAITDTHSVRDAAADLVLCLQPCSFTSLALSTAVLSPDGQTIGWRDAW
jgi:hypothetical protein